MRVAIVIAFLCVALGSCTVLFSNRPVHSIYVRNSGTQVWLVRVPMPYEDLFWVTTVKPGAEGVASPWAEQPSPDAEIEILDVQCHSVAAFRPVDGTAYPVPEASGLEITIVPWDTTSANPDGIIPGEECGGYLLG